MSNLRTEIAHSETQAFGMGLTVDHLLSVCPTLDRVSAPNPRPIENPMTQLVTLSIEEGANIFGIAAIRLQRSDKARHFGPNRRSLNGYRLHRSNAVALRRPIENGVAA